MCEKWSIGKILTQRPIDFNALDQDGQTAFVWACKFVIDTQVAPESMFLAGFLLDQDKIDFNFPNSSGRTGFHLACQFQIQPLVELIVSKSSSKNIDLNAKDKSGLTGFHLSCAFNCNPDLLKYLFTIPSIDQVAQDKYGRSGLHLACTNEKLHNVQLILEHNPDLIDLQDQYGQTVFHRACENGQCQVLKMLINHDVQIAQNMLEIKDKCGRKCLDLAFKYDKKSIQHILQEEPKEDLIQELIQKPIIVNKNEPKIQMEIRIHPSSAIRNIA